jgi:hypothetical protein
MPSAPAPKPPAPRSSSQGDVAARARTAVTTATPTAQVELERAGEPREPALGTVLIVNGQDRKLGGHRCLLFDHLSLSRTSEDSSWSASP